MVGCGGWSQFVTWEGRSAVPASFLCHAVLGGCRGASPLGGTNNSPLKLKSNLVQLGCARFSFPLKLWGWDLGFGTDGVIEDLFVARGEKLSKNYSIVIWI